MVEYGEPKSESVTRIESTFPAKSESGKVPPGVLGMVRIGIFFGMYLLFIITKILEMCGNVVFEASSSWFKYKMLFSVKSPKVSKNF